MKNKFLVLLFLIFNATSLFSQLSKTHYIPPITGAGGGSGPGIQVVYISTPSPSIVNYTIRNGGDSGTIYATGQVTNTDSEEIELSGQPASGQSWGEIFVQQSEVETVLNKGFIITADSEIYVSYRFVSQNRNQAGALVSKGISALGTRFRAGMLQNYNTFNGHIGFISVMATENRTTINFDLQGSVQTTGGKSSHSITLEKFQSYIIANNDDTESLIGSLISSDKNIVVNTGAYGSFDSSSGGQDYGIDQIVGSTIVGSEYIFIKGIADDAIETVLIIADQNNTNINVNGAPYEDSNGDPIILNSGDYAYIKGNKFNSEGNLYVNTNDPNDKLFAYQGTGKNYIYTDSNGNSSSQYLGANQGMYFVPPLNCATKGDVDNIPYIDIIGERAFDDPALVSFITKKNAEVFITDNNLNSVDVNTLSTAKDVTGNSDYVTYKVDNLTGNVKVESNDEIYVAYVNVNAAATTAGFYSGFTIPPTVELDAELKTLGSCLNKDGTSNIELKASNFTQFDEIKWMKKDGVNLIETGEIGEYFIPSEEGIYVLKGLLACNNNEYLSPEIVVNICPDDSDNDGIIDNIDLDLDNDGILNSIESNGEIIFDLSDFKNPSLENNGTTLGISVSNNSSDLNSGSVLKTIEGFIDGNINSTIPTTTKDTIVNAYNFDENLNLSFKYQSTGHAIVDGEYFEIIAFPSSKNITLIDPENHLLILKPGESSYTEVESLNGLKQFSSNTIRFKFNSEKSTIPEFEFIGYNLTGISFKHYVENNSQESIFRANIKGLDYAINSDENHPTNSDSVPDYLDIDSDGDECNDVTEAGFDDGILIDGVLGDVVPTFDDSQVDSRGRIIDPTHDYNTLPLNDNVTGNYYFQQIGQAVEIMDEPTSTSGCIGDTVSFSVNASHSSNNIDYQWQFFDTNSSEWVNLDDSNTKITGYNSFELIITDIDTSLVGDYRVQLKTDEYKCIVNSNLGANIGLTVNALPENPILLEIQTFCQSDIPKISDLTTKNLGSNTLYWYDSIDSLAPLDSSTLLEHNTFYYAEYVDEKGCVSSGRTESKAFISNPKLISSLEELCIGETASLSIENIAKTASDFAKDNDLIFITNNGEPVSWPTEYGDTYFLIQANTNKVGFEPIDWPDAKELTDSYNSGDSNASARMYVVLNADMENAVWNGLNSMGLTGSNGVAFWLGLYQDLNDPDYQEPGNEAQNYAGWKWVNGQKLSETGYTNWFTAEPNNAGGIEHHGQFEFGNFGIKWNDMSVGNQNGKSWPLFEYSGSTDIVWGYYDKDGNEIEFTEQPGTGSLDISPTETTTYYVKVSVNDVICYAEKTVIVNTNPIANTIQDYVFCDDDLDGDANNGSIVLEESNFEVLKPSILGDNQSVNDFTVSFHLSEDDAQTNSPIFFPFKTPEKDPLKLHWESQTTEIFVRIVNNTTGCVNVGSSFNLVINTLPITFEVEDIILCDDNRDGIVDGFDLSSRTNELRSGNEFTDPDDTDNQSPDNFPVSYHLSIDDANDLNNNGLVSPYKSGNDIIYYRIEKRSNQGDLICIKTGEAFELKVESLPFANEVSILRQCDGDDPLDTDSQDGKFPFDVSGIQEKLLDGQTDVTTYYFDENDVFIGNVLPNIFETTSQTITITVENNSDLKCSDSTTLEFIVDDSPELYEVIVPSQCDDGVSDVDGYSEFDTSLITQTLLTNPLTSQMQSLTDYSVSYTYVDEDGNTQVTNELPNPFNTQTQSVSVTVTNKINNSCIISENIEFIVTPLPVINENLIKIEQCDDGKGSENDGVTLHNLTESQSLFSTNFSNETFEYYSDENLTQKIDNPASFYNDPLYDEVWVKIITENGCERISKNQDGNERLKIEITVGASEISETFIEDNNTLYSVCEDSDALSQDGLSLFSSSVLQEINTKLINSNPKFAEQNIKVTLHRNSTDGLTGENPINLNEDFTSSTPYTQEIWARIVNIDITEFTCLGYAKVGELYVEPKPIANPVTIEKQCDGDSPLDLDSQDGIYPFDVSLIEEQVINGQSGTSVTYFNEDGTQIENFGPFFETASQTITIRVERDPSYPNVSNPDGLCYDETTLEFIVNDSPEAYPLVLDAHCDGDDGGSDTDGYDIFDTSNVISTLTTNPDTGVSQDVSKLNIRFTYIDELGVVKTDNKLPNPFNTKTQTVSVTIENPLNLNCVITQEIDFVVNPLPSFDIDDETIVCLNPLPDNPIEVGTFNWNGANDPTIYNYSWSRVDLNGLNDTSFNETTESIKVDKGGVYTVIVEDAVTFCTRSKSITVTESEMATISLDNITVEDLTNDNTNTITIDTLNLGIGDYEFSLDEAFGPYQDEPIFESVKPGIHTIYIRDKNSYYTYDYGCGIAQIDVSVIGYRKYFTPNGDGVNETWKILGIRSDFNAGSKVYIFDRFGKLLKELDPLTKGWDGTYLGKPMPATDYWFRTFLEDGREFKGHFSLVRGN